MVIYNKMNNRQPCTTTTPCDICMSHPEIREVNSNFFRSYCDSEEIRDNSRKTSPFLAHLSDPVQYDLMYALNRDEIVTNSHRMINVGCCAISKCVDCDVAVDSECNCGNKFNNLNSMHRCSISFLNIKMCHLVKRVGIHL